MPIPPLVDSGALHACARLNSKKLPLTGQKVIEEERGNSCDPLKTESVQYEIGVTEKRLCFGHMDTSSCFHEESKKHNFLGCSAAHGGWRIQVRSATRFNEG